MKLFWCPHLTRTSFEKKIAPSCQWKAAGLVTHQLLLQQGRGPSHSFLLLFFWKPVFSISALKHHEFYNCDEKLAELRAWPWSAGKKEVSTQFHFFLIFNFYFWWLFKERKKKPSQLMVREERRFSCCHQSRWCHSTSQHHHLLFKLICYFSHLNHLNKQL